jgi:DNA-binding SARP family transcriptional activator/tetratricopeptide (TPR) repeat protein
VQIRLLGPVELRIGDHWIDAGPPLRRAVLAALAVDVGRLVPVDTLVYRAWGDQPPERAARTLHTYVTGIRRLLEQVRSTPDGTTVQLVGRRGGYVLEVAPREIDIHRFRCLADPARHGDDVATLREALALWRAEPLAAVPGDWADRTRQAWHRERCDVVVRWVQAEFVIGDPGRLIGPLSELVARYPLVEPLSRELMRVLHAAGRSAEALELYASVQRRLADELGADPSAELQAVHVAVLRGDPRFSRSAGVVRPAPRAAFVPAQLPADVYGFAGRADQIEYLDGLLTGLHGQAPTAVVISAVSGTPGVGKTALAVHWAHRVAAEFPDGQMYLHLRGFAPEGRVTTPAEALHTLLSALGVPPERIPPSLDAQIGLYRSQLAGRRMLVVLDNARDAAQVRPLLPGSPTVLTVVTSRNKLTGLVATEGARPIMLDVLSTEDARDLLARRLGSDRVAAEPASVDQIIAHCSRLPLALAIAAAHAQHNHLPLANLAAELERAAARLDVLDAGEPTTQVRAVFSWSYRTLTPDTARLFRLLGLHPGPDLTAAAAASLAGLPASKVRASLTELTRVHLIAEHTPGRYALHDLLRAYAAELVTATEDEQTRTIARLRTFDHYMHTARTAALVLQPHQDLLMDSPSRPGVTPERIVDQRQALAWFAAEHRVLLAVVSDAAAGGSDAHALQLAAALSVFFQRQGHWHDQLAVQGIAQALAVRLGELPAAARAHRSLAGAYIRLGQHDRADAHLREALTVWQRLGDTAAEARTYMSLADVLDGQGRYEEALVYSRQSLLLYEHVNDPVGRARALTLVGWYLSRLGRHEEALERCESALAAMRALGDRSGQAGTMTSLGYAHWHLGNHREAIDRYQGAIDIYRELGDRYYEADTLTQLGDALADSGDRAAAVPVWQQALDILDQLNNPDAMSVRARLKSPVQADDHVQANRPAR